MSSVTLASRMRRVMLVLAAAAVLVMMMAFSAAPAMAGAGVEASAFFTPFELQRIVPSEEESMDCDQSAQHSRHPKVER